MRSVYVNDRCAYFQRRPTVALKRHRCTEVSASYCERPCSDRTGALSLRWPRIMDEHPQNSNDESNDVSGKAISQDYQRTACEGDRQMTADVALTEW